MLSENLLLNEFNIDKKTPIIVGVSGGVDSMVLLDILIKHGFKPIVVHFNHQTRDTNLRDQNLVVDFTKKNKVKSYVYKIKVRKGNFQNEARKMRYNKLMQVAKKYNTPYIATAHHLDDLAETVLIKITRGSNLHGYAGIHKIIIKDNFTFIKPLLSLDKSTILKYAKENEVPFFEDESNFYDNYLRNRYRHTILPILKQENPQILNKFLNFHTQLKEASLFIRNEANKYLIENNKFLVTTYKDLDIVIQKELIICLLEQKNLTSTFETINKIRLMILNENANSSYDLENDYVLIKSYNEVYVIKNMIESKFDLIIDKDILVLPNMKKITFLNNSSINSPESVKICYNKLSLPLRARTRKPGDVLTFSYGHKKLKDHLIDLKIPKHLRGHLWMLTDNNDTILWVSNNVYTNKTIGNKNEIIFTVGE